MRRALPGPAVGDDLLLRGDPLRLIELAQLLRTEEGLLLGSHRLAPRAVAGSGLKALAPVLLGGARVDQYLACPAHHHLGHLAPVGADLVVALGHRIAAGGGGAEDLRNQRPSLQPPFVAPAVEQLNRVAAVVIEVAGGVGGEPVLVAPVEDDPGLKTASEAVQLAGELLRTEEVPLQLTLEVVAPVPPQRARAVALGVGFGVLVDVENPQILVD